MILTAEQLRAGRAMLRLDQGQLGDLAQVSGETIKRFEGMAGVIRGREETVRSIRSAMEYAGLEFLFDDTPMGPIGTGVRMALRPEMKFRNLVAETVKECAELVLDVELKRDPQLYQQGPKIIARLLAEGLPHWLEIRLVTAFQFKK